MCPVSLSNTGAILEIQRRKEDSAVSAMKGVGRDIFLTSSSVSGSLTYLGETVGKQQICTYPSLH